jgi:GST-like protein
MWTLFGAPGSGSAAVEIALARCAVPYRVLRAATWEPESALAELQRANPLGQVPTLQFDDGGVMTESAAILIHLGLAFPASGLLPADGAARAQALRGLVFIAANCYAAIGVIDYPERWFDGGSEADHERLRLGARRRLHGYWDLFADQFGGAPGLAGGEPDALAILAAVVSRWSGARAHLRQSRPGLLGALERVEADPVAAPVFARHWPA